MPITLNGDTGITTPTYGGANTAEYLVPVTAFKNRIINGAMMIDQRNAGASVTPTNNTYTLDRWASLLSQTSKYSVQQNAGSVTPPAGFTNYLGVTSLSSYSVNSTDFFSQYQPIEGYNFADLGWGTANAKTITISFQVYSSLTGTFGGTLLNSAANRCYVFSYSIPVANTWTTISVTIAGDTTGTWLTTNGIGCYVIFSLGAGASVSGTAGSWGSTLFRSATGAVSVVGTNGATFYITGVQLEVGSTATSFDYRPYGTELALCQRYCETSYNAGVSPGTASNSGNITTYVQLNGNYCTGGGIGVQFKVTKRADPTVTVYNRATGTAGELRDDNIGANVAATVDLVGQSGFRAYVSVSAGQALNLTGHYLATAEL